MKFDFPREIKSNFQGYVTLIDFFHQTKDLFIDEIILDFQNTSWFDANLLALLGAILHGVNEQWNDVKLINIPSKIEELWQRNHFMSHFGGYTIMDYNETTIKYRNFKPSEEKLFKEYLDSELLSKRDLPDMSNLLRKKINESIFEIFNNAVIHGNCKNIFSCGQYFPIKKKLYFTIVDMGTTIRDNVCHYLNRNISEHSISWAVKEGHTTKRGTIPGGLGLSLIRSFLEKNKGGIQIISSNEFWSQKGNNIFENIFLQEFTGTIVNLELNINDPKHYILAEEINLEDIF